MIPCLQKDFFLAGEENGTLSWIVRVVVLSCLRWGTLCILLCVHYSLMWNRILQYGRRGLLHILLFCMLRASCAGVGGRFPESFNLLKSAIWGKWWV
jgi:hypothetical protein